LILHSIDEENHESVSIKLPTDNSNTGTECNMRYSSFTEFLRDYLFQQEYNKEHVVDSNGLQESLKDRILLSRKSRADLFAANQAGNMASAAEHRALHQKYKQELEKREADALCKSEAEIADAKDKANMQDAILKKQGAWAKMDSHVSHSYLSKILSFLRALGIDVSVFKQGQSYCYTWELVDLFRWILNTPSSIRTQYQKAQFSKIPFREAHVLYKKIVATIQSIPDSSVSTPEKKLEQINNLKELLSNYYEFDIQEFPPENLVLNEILNSVWFFAMWQHWAKQSESFEFTQDDRVWQCIVDQVYIDLWHKGIIVKGKSEKTDGGVKTILKICDSLPEQCKSRQFERFNPNMDVNSRKYTVIHNTVFPTDQEEM